MAQVGPHGQIRAQDGNQKPMIRNQQCHGPMSQWLVVVDDLPGATRVDVLNNMEKSRRNLSRGLLRENKNPGREMKVCLISM